MRPSIISTQHPLPFCNLEPRRFEDLCLRIAVSKCDLKNPKHPGRSGSDKGKDIDGTAERDGKDTNIAIQCKRYEKIYTPDLIKALRDFLDNNFSYNGEFWIMTSASVSYQSREQFQAVADKEKINVTIVDGSLLENHVRSVPDILEEFFLTPSSFIENHLKEILLKCIKVIQKFQIEFLRELNRSFSGNFPFILERQKIMGDLVFATIAELKSEFTTLPFKIEGLKEIEQSANSIISNYRMKSQTSDDGLPLLEKRRSH